MTHSPSSEGHRRRVTLTVAASYFMLLLDGTILNTSLPQMAVSLNVAPLTLSAAVTIYLLAGAAVLPLTAWLGERYGLRRMFVVGIALFTLASLLCGLAQDAPQLVLARAFQGFGGGLMMPIGRTMALQRARKEDFIRIAALLTWPALFAPVLGPPLGGLITTYASWRWNFLLNVPLGALAIVLILRWVAVDVPVQQRPLDRRGAIGAALGLMLVLGGLEWIAHVIGQGEAQLPALLTTAAGFAVMAWTVRHLRRASNPVVSLAPLAQRTFAIATAAGGTFGSMCLQSCPFLLPLLFQLALGRNAVNSGALLMPYFLGNLGMKSVTTPILVRFGFRKVMVTATGCSAASIAAFGFLSPQTPWAALVTLLFFAGCARSMLLTAITSLTFADIPLAQRGAASTLSTVSTQVSATLGVAVGAILLALAQFMHGDQQLALPDFRIAFLAMSVISVLTLIPFSRLPRDAGAEMIGRTASSGG
jgi:EmrB/QacA subfamily drug resistance transporter